MRIFHAYSLLWVEFLFLLLGATLIRITGGFPFGALNPLWVMGKRIVRSPRLAIAFSFTLPILLRLALWIVLPVPRPFVHDEFSYLLLADTFGHGRLTNPTHPLWVHFDTIHVLQHPTYASIYPVMQGLFLALGQIVFHNPWAGVVLSIGLMCAAICWALRGWLPPFWALAGSVLAAVRLGIFGDWMNSYFGGAAAASGGALVLGALPRVLRRANKRDALLLALGMVILANSRPYEGFFLCVPVAIALGAWLFRAENLCRALGLRLAPCPPFRTMVWNLVMPAGAALVLGGLLMTAYFWRVTGGPLTMPYVSEARQYGITPLFIWQKLRPVPSYSDERLRYFYTEWASYQPGQALRWFMYWGFYVGPTLSLPLIATGGLIRDRQVRFLGIACAFTAVALAVEWWAEVRYGSVATVALYGLILQGLRHLRCATRHSRRRKIAVLIPATVVTMFALQVAMACSQFVAPAKPIYRPAKRRFEIESMLRRLGGEHLVLVRYQEHNTRIRILNEWVYNAADIDHAPIVWARELDPERNRQLLQYFKGRRVWIVDPDQGELTPFR